MWERKIMGKILKNMKIAHAILLVVMIPILVAASRA